MSGALLRDSRGSVISRYPDPTVRRDFHDERKEQPSDRQRCALIEAEREILTMSIIFDHLELSGIARTRLEDALIRIRRALNLKRRAYGMAQTDGADVARCYISPGAA